MPDVHLGKGVTIGTVFASDKFVCPNAVGVDIGCGMCAVPIPGLHVDDVSLETKQQMQSLIKRRIPTGFNEHPSPLPHARVELDEISQRHPPSAYVTSAMRAKKVAKQLGTLGGGNHFLEIVHDEEGQVWIMLHSGSRNIGNTTAAHYDSIAKDTMRRFLPKDVEVPPGLNFLEIESEDGQAYLKDMNWCQDYAYHNRQSMLHIMCDVVEETTKRRADLTRAVNIHHNYCSCEDCTYTDPASGEQVSRKLWVTRKGATSAKAGQYGIIPGSMGTGSYIVRGKGTSESWSSCSHGAGRKMSRNAAVKNIEQDEFVKVMEGIVCDTHPGVRDEAPQAYKDLEEVMSNQASLVDVVHQLKVMVNVKGYETKPRKEKRRNGSKRNGGRK